MIDRTRQFETATLAHLDAAYNLARWLLRDEHQAHDVVQEAYLRAFRFFDTLRGQDAKPWLLGIVRNECFTWMRQHAYQQHEVEWDEAQEAAGLPEDGGTGLDPEALLLQKHEVARVNACLAKVPALFREVLILRELEDMSYDSIARVVGIPQGTVMSRLSRGRAMLKAQLTAADLQERL